MLTLILIIAEVLAPRAPSLKWKERRKEERKGGKKKEEEKEERKEGDMSTDRVGRAADDFIWRP